MNTTKIKTDQIFTENRINATDLKIIKVETYKVLPRWLFLKITTANGLTGWGEPVIEGRADTVRAAVEELTPYIINQPANKIEDIWQVLYRGGFYRGGPVLMSAIAGIDQALWDIKGKALGVPVYELLGGAVRHKMKVYGWIGGDRPENIASAAKERVDAGYLALKMNASTEIEWIDTPAKVDAIVERVGTVRETVGKEIGIGLDFHGRIHRGMAKVVARELESFRLMFIEEPVLTENNESLKAIQQATSTPIATGERMFSRWDFKQVFQDGTVDIIQPDLSHAGGISEVKRIATMAEAYDVAIAPHCPLGPISFAAALQLDFCTINAAIQETSMGIHYNEGTDLLDYLVDPEVFRFDNGHVNLLERPGLGIEINEEKVHEMEEAKHQWKNPIWRHEDGSFAEW